MVDARPDAGSYLRPWLRYTRALIHSGRYDPAGTLLDSILTLSPEFCDARALAAGLPGRRNAPAVRAGAHAIVAAAEQDSRTDSMWCGVVAAAVIGDASRAAALIERIAASPAAMQIDDASIGVDVVLFDQRRTWYPWTQVAASPRLIAAVRRLTAARDAVKLQLPSLLPPLPRAPQP